MWNVHIGRSEQKQKRWISSSIISPVVSCRVETPLAPSVSPRTRAKVRLCRPSAHLPHTHEPCDPICGAVARALLPITIDKNVLTSRYHGLPAAAAATTRKNGV